MGFRNKGTSRLNWNSPTKKTNMVFWVWPYYTWSKFGQEWITNKKPAGKKKKKWMILQRDQVIPGSFNNEVVYNLLDNTWVLIWHFLNQERFLHLCFMKIRIFTNCLAFHLNCWTLPCTWIKQELDSPTYLTSSLSKLIKFFLSPDSKEPYILS